MQLTMEGIRSQSPRNRGRNDKGKSTPRRAQQKQKALKATLRQLKH